MGSEVASDLDRFLDFFNVPWVAKPGESFVNRDLHSDVALPECNNWDLIEMLLTAYTRFCAGRYEYFAYHKVQRAVGVTTTMRGFAQWLARYTDIRPVLILAEPKRHKKLEGVDTYGINHRLESIWVEHRLVLIDSMQNVSESQAKRIDYVLKNFKFRQNTVVYADIDAVPRFIRGMEAL